MRDVRTLYCITAVLNYCITYSAKAWAVLQSNVIAYVSATTITSTQCMHAAQTHANALIVLLIPHVNVLVHLNTHSLTVALAVAVVIADASICALCHYCTHNR
jgi:hypothetical protein